MPDKSFLEKLASKLLADYDNKLREVVVILPNRRAKVFLIDALKNQTEKNIFAPKITSIEDFIQEIAGVRAIDDIEVLFEFYTVYLSITDIKHQQPFEQFANWAKTLLKDFNEIDRYLIDPMFVLSYLKDIEDIKKWGLEIEDRTVLIENYIDFWKLLPNYYTVLYSHLLERGIGYQGLIYREAIKKIADFSDSATPLQFIFAGFNALNAAEEVIIQHLIKKAKAHIYWDIDSVFLQDIQHDAGLFIRRYKQNWQHYKTNPFEWISNHFTEVKRINIIGTSKSIGQAKIAASIINDKIVAGDKALNKVAIVLGEENLLVPLLYSLPMEVNALNITMGYSAKNNPVQILIAKLFKMHSNALSRSGNSYVLYYKDVIDILTHPLVEPYGDTKDLVRLINANNYTFITHTRLNELQSNRNELFILLFDKWDQSPVMALENISNLLQLIKNNLSTQNDEEKITRAFVYAIYKVINKLTSYFSNNNGTVNVETLFAIYKQVIELAEVSFEGEPLDGLQIMGVLESRVLDFETVIVTSMNEGKFPAGKSQNSFIPYDVKRELGLPTFKEKDAIYTYHFYHLLQRAKNIYLLYNTESDGIDGGEKSRFITQLEVEKQSNHILTHDIYNSVTPPVAYTPVVIQKSESVIERLQEIATTGFSPSALTSYIRNPLQFYFQKILRIREVDEVEENIALNTLGTIIHETLRVLYEPLIDKLLTVSDINQCIAAAEVQVLTQFKTIYKEGEIKKGRNLLAFEVAKRHVVNFLKFEIAAIESGDNVKILAVEQTFERVLEHPSLPFPVKIRGNVDRIEDRNGTIRIIDYKTGKVEARNLVLESWNGLINDIKNDKIIQVLAYAFIFEERVQSRQIEVGIISFKNMKTGFLPFTFRQDKINVSILNQEITGNYQEQLVMLLNEILDAEIPFTEKMT